MFRGDEIRVDEFRVIEVLSARRVRFVAEVNGVTCFVKTFGDAERRWRACWRTWRPLGCRADLWTAVMCATDELKALVGVPRLGCSRATVPEYGPILLARYLPGHRRANAIRPTAELARQILPILWFDVWIRNNDRTGTNILVLDDAVVPIDEAAAFQRPATYRLTPRRAWYELLAPMAPGGRPAGGWPPERSAVVEILQRTLPTWAECAEWLQAQALEMEALWEAFWREAAQRVDG